MPLSGATGGVRRPLQLGSNVVGTGAFGMCKLAAVAGSAVVGRDADCPVSAEYRYAREHAASSRTGAAGDVWESLDPRRGGRFQKRYRPAHALFPYRYSSEFTRGARPGRNSGASRASAAQWNGVQVEPALLRNGGWRAASSHRKPVPAVRANRQG